MSRIAGLREGELVVAALCAAQFMLILDVVVIYVALPSISRDLPIAGSMVHLVGVAYTAAFGSLLIVFGRVGDLLGRRRVLLSGLALFVAASLAAALAQADWQLFASRAVQGIGAAMVSSNALAAINDRFEEGPNRNAALGVWAMVGSAGAIAGQLLGGVITEYLGWRAIFLINLPVGALVIAVLATTLHESRAERPARLDVRGSILLTGALGCGVLALVELAQGQNHGLAGALLAGALLVGAAALGALFVLLERRTTDPVLQLARVG